MPREQVDAVRYELSDGMPKPGERTEEQRFRLGPNGSAQSESELIHQPLYCQSLCHPAVVGIAQTMLDAHVRIAQHGRRNVGSDDQMENGEPGGYGPVANRTLVSNAAAHFLQLDVGADSASYAQTGRTTCLLTEQATLKATRARSASRFPTFACA